MDKRRVTTALAKYAANPVTKLVAGRMIWALLETRGRKTGAPRRNPVAYRLQDGALWIVAEHGWRSNYVRNLMSDPRVRVKVKGRWRTGRASPVPDDDVRARRRMLGWFHGGMIGVAGTDPLSIRIDLEP